MARRSSVSDFLRNFGMAYNLSRQVGDDLQLASIAGAKPEQSTGFTAEDGKQLEAIANAKDADGNPLYSLTANEDGSYKVASTADPSQSGTIGQRTVTDFLGKRTDGAMTDDQVASARQQAMAGVISRRDPVGGMQMLNSIKQNERDTQRFGWERSNNERAIRKADQAEADDAAVRDADTAASDWLKNRLLNPDGTSRAGTVDDHLATSQFRAMKLAENGRLNESSAVYKDFAAQSAIKIQMETAERDQALGKASVALAAGDFAPLKDFYNRFVPDGAHVLDVKRDKGGQIVIERETADGRKMPPTVMKDTGQLVSALASFKDPMAIYQYSQHEFRNNLMLRADNRAAAAAGREAQSFAEHAPQRQLASTVATLQLGLGNTDDPAQRAGIQGKLNAIQGGLGLGKEQPAEVKLAQAFLGAGLATDMRDALEMATSKKGKSPDDLHQEFVAAGVKNMSKPEDAVKTADEVMASMGYSKRNGRWSAPKPDASAAAASGIPAPDKREVGQTYDTPRGKLIWRGNGWEQPPSK